VSTSARVAGLVLVTALLGACSGQDTGSAAAPDGSGAPSTGPSAGPSTGPSEGAGPGATACDEVVAGIDAFNAGDLDETVAAFERAVPLAEAEDAAAGTRASGELLDAVRYYALLPAEDYPAAAATSPEFARFKAITLGQCVAGRPPVDEDDGVLA
jgi:hypothetical protein